MRRGAAFRVPDAAALAVALLALAATLAAAVARPGHPAEAVAAGGALLLCALGVISARAAVAALRSLAPTVGFLAALLLLAEGARREGVFDALGALMASGAHTSAKRLLALVVVIAAAVTALLSLDATVVLLTPIVFVTATRMRAGPRPHLYACAHLANSASLLLPVSNLTNLLAFRDTHLSFAHFAAVMALPTLAVVLVEWFVLHRVFAGELGAAGAEIPSAARPPPPRFALAVLALTLGGFALSSVVGVAPVWFAAAGAAVMSLRGLRSAGAGRRLARAAEPGFLIFVLGLGVIVAAAEHHGLGSFVHGALPGGVSLPDLLAVAGVSAILANVVNNLPATLMIAPALAGSTGAVLAMLIGVNIGPNLTYTGSLATLLWRRVLRGEGVEVDVREYVRVGARTVALALVVATVVLWLVLRA